MVVSNCINVIKQINGGFAGGQNRMIIMIILLKKDKYIVNLFMNNT
jgi:hypothetical protein